MEIGGLPDLPPAEGPDAGDGAEERALARAGGAFDEHTVARFDAGVDSETSTRPVGSAKSRLRNSRSSMAASATTAGPTPARLSSWRQEDRFVKAGETVHGRLPRGEVGVGADEPGKCPCTWPKALEICTRPPS